MIYYDTWYYYTTIYITVVLNSQKYYNNNDIYCSSKLTIIHNDIAIRYYALRYHANVNDKMIQRCDYYK